MALEEQAAVRQRPMTDHHSAALRKKIFFGATPGQKRSGTSAINLSDPGVFFVCLSSLPWHSVPMATEVSVDEGEKNVFFSFLNKNCSADF